MSADARFVVFLSRSDNVVPGDTNIQEDVFLRDRSAATTELISVSQSGAQANGQSYYPWISADGNHVVFESRATNLVGVDLNGVDDVFVRDRISGTTELISASLTGPAGNGQSGGIADISADGRYVVFTSDASNLVPGDINGLTDTFVRDRLMATTELVSVSTSGVAGNGNSTGWRATISSDGRFVAFSSNADNLVANDINGHMDVFLRDRLLGTTVIISVGSNGIQSNGTECWHPSISGDGQRIVYECNADNLDGQNPEGWNNIYLRDHLLGTTVRMSQSAWGTNVLHGGSYHPQISANGRTVGFGSFAYLINGQSPTGISGFVRDVDGGVPEFVCVPLSGTNPSSLGGLGSISADGRYVSFGSEAHNLVPGYQAGHAEVYLRDRGNSPFTSYCFGDGSSTPCPCGNLGATGKGCANSSHSNGARLVGVGIASITHDTVQLLGSDMPAEPAIYYQGTQPLNGSTPIVFGDGLRCVGGRFVRLVTRANSMNDPTLGTGSSYYGWSFGDTPLSERGGIPASGTTRYYQVLYRDSALAFCTTAAFNETNGLEVSWSP